MLCMQVQSIRRTHALVEEQCVRDIRGVVRAYTAPHDERETAVYWPLCLYIRG